jgi:hypothetical protein
MNDPRDARAAVGLSAQERSLLAKPSPSRGYVPQGEDLEPEDAPAGAASASFPAPGGHQSADREPEFHG